MKNKNKQFGSSYVIVVITLSVIILGLIGFIIWRNFGQSKQSNQSSTTNVSNTAKTETSNAKTQTSTTNVADETDSSPTADDSSVKYFAIDFWNIKGVYSGSHYLSYSISDNNTLFFDSSELPASCTEGVARIKRFSADEYTSGYPATTQSGSSDKKASEAFEKNAYSDNGGNKKVGDYYYVLTTPMQYCADTKSEVLQKTIFADVLEYFKTLKVK